MYVYTCCTLQAGQGEREVGRLREDQARVWSLELVNHLELGEEVAEEGLYNGESFAVVQSYQG